MSTYTIGQAVIITASNYESLVFIVANTSYLQRYEVEYLSGGTTSLHYQLDGIEHRPATAPEILEEIQKHGWEVEDETYLIFSPSKAIVLYNCPTYCDVADPLCGTPTKETILLYGKECIEADRLIKALNLAK